jgi:DNA-nicking Smr family endonuclease
LNSGKKNKPKKLQEDPYAQGAQDDELFLNALDNMDDDLLGDKFAADEIDGKQNLSKKNKKGLQTKSIDLHGLTVDEAVRKIDQLIDSITAEKQGLVLIKVITGKGRHSGSAGPVLAKEIHYHVKNKYFQYIEQIQTSPADELVNGVPIRGHFDVTIKT